MIALRIAGYGAVAVAVILISLHGVPAIAWQARPGLHLPILIAAIVSGVGGMFTVIWLDTRAAVAAREYEQCRRKVRDTEIAVNGAVTERDRERQVHQQLTRALTELQQARIALLRQLDSAEITAETAWEACIDASLGALVNLWRNSYFNGEIAPRVRATLFEVRAGEVVPLRRSSGNAQADPAQTRWKVGEGIVGLVAGNAAVGFVPSITFELNAAQKENRAPRFVIRREEHRSIESVLCLPVKSRGETVSAVLCLDADSALATETYQKNISPTHPSVPVHIFVAEFIYLLEIRPRLQKK